MPAQSETSVAVDRFVIVGVATEEEVRRKNLVKIEVQAKVQSARVITLSSTPPEERTRLEDSHGCWGARTHSPAWSHLGHPAYAPGEHRARMDADVV